MFKRVSTFIKLGTLNLTSFFLFAIVSQCPLFRPYNARLTREAVAPFRPAWKGRAKGGSGATFAVRPTLMTHPSKGRDGHAESVLNRLLYGGSTQVTVALYSRLKGLSDFSISLIWFSKLRFLCSVLRRPKLILHFHFI